ncbi:hypothetical protein F3I62_02215 [Pseudomonas sp. R-28-1W-6]|jgi:hypothetical protein|uniref:hypothetical protein n=1 Tax=Pseudomonas sp. R-28-1W-6 TaxID=2650101 RepID=UPI0013659A6C|nr:hypothetical protein [Pseudomonas sp. R-28-1W-6]MWV10897.1 hypothetical protein [Pseudomonas sp. R-28-1W-6]
MNDELPPLELSLEPLEESSPPPNAPRQKASFPIDTRDNHQGERRKNGERRQTVRFEADRRSGQDRRSGNQKGWKPGVDI